MAKWTKDFLGSPADTGDEDRLTYKNGFRFGFGFFVAWVLGFMIVGVFSAVAAAIFGLR